MEKCNIGLEIGSSKIAAIVGLHEKNKIKIIGFSERRFTPSDEVIRLGNIENAQKTSELIGEILEELAKSFENSEVEFSFNTVNVNLSNLTLDTHVKNVRVVTANGSNRVRQEDIDRLAEDAYKSFKAPGGYSVIHNLPKDFYVNEDLAVSEVVGKIGNQISGNFQMFTTKTEDLEHLLECVNQVPAKGTESGYLNVESVFLNSIADSCSLLNNSVEEPESKREGVAIVNIGAEMTELCIYHANSLRYHSVIPIAGNAINSDLQKAFGLRFDEAETLKLLCSLIANTNDDSTIVKISQKYGMPDKEVYLKNALTVIEWRLRELATLINAELHKSGYKGNLLNGLILTGGTSQFGNISAVFSQTCKNIIIRPLLFNSAIDFSGFSQLRNARYSTLLGLIVAPAFNFDRRIDNRILTPKPIENLHPQPEIPKTGKDEKSQKGTSSLRDFVSGLFNKPNNDLNDKYNDEL